MSMKWTSAIVLAVATAASSAALGQVPDYGLNWCTVGSPGNRGASVELGDFSSDARTCGSVGYEYRLTKTELTHGQWLEFVRAYAPYWTGPSRDIAFTGEFIYPDSSGVYQVQEKFRDVPVSVTWEMGARYCNWLHNEKRTDQAAFQSGAYDTSTFYFTANEYGYFNVSHHQATRSPGARYWIPSLDEMLKAQYYDPHRYGPGLEGYWLYNQGSDTAPVSGLPGVGTTNTGLGVYYANAGQYPNITSPWGLLDTSGGLPEWTETQLFEMSRDRAVLGSPYGGAANFTQFLDSLSYNAEFGTIYPVNTATGVRIASTIPSPSCVGVIIGWMCLGLKRKHKGIRA